MLIDTGAYKTVMDRGIAEALGLEPIRFEEMSGISHVPEECRVFLLSVAIGLTDGSRTSTLIFHIRDDRHDNAADSEAIQRAFWEGISFAMFALIMTARLDTATSSEIFPRTSRGNHGGHEGHKVKRRSQRDARRKNRK